MPAGIVAAEMLGSALPAIGQTVLQNWFNNRAIDKQNEANMNLAKYSYEQQKKMIQEQNEYNSPAAQMQRYQDAGLNPNLIYSQGTPGNQSQVASYNAPQIQAKRYDFSGLSDLIDNLYTLRQWRADLDLKQAQVASAREAAESAYMDNLYKKWLYGFDIRDNIERIPGYAPIVSRYNAETSGIQELVALRQGQQIINSLSAAQQRYIIDNILPYQSRQGQLNTELLGKQVRLYNWKFGTDMTAKALGTVLLGLKLLL